MKSTLSRRWYGPAVGTRVEVIEIVRKICCLLFVIESPGCQGIYDGCLHGAGDGS
jgi:hypothetical protein